MTISLDSTQISTVVLCDLCPWWHGFADSRDEGWRVGARHEARAHPELDQARDALAQREARARHAAEALSGVRTRLDAPERGQAEPAQSSEGLPAVPEHDPGRHRQHDPVGVSLG